MTDVTAVDAECEDKEGEALSHSVNHTSGCSLCPVAKRSGKETRLVWSTMSLQPDGSNRAVRNTFLPVHTHWSIRHTGVRPHYVSMDCLEEEIGSGIHGVREATITES